MTVAMATTTVTGSTVSGASWRCLLCLVRALPVDHDGDHYLPVLLSKVSGPTATGVLIGFEGLLALFIPG